MEENSMKRFTPAEMARMKEALYMGLARGETDVREATRRMRKILGMSQKDYARKVAGIFPSDTVPIRKRFR